MVGIKIAVYDQHIRGLWVDDRLLRNVLVENERYEGDTALIKKGC